MFDILMIDNLDSFTYNLVDLLRSFGYPVYIFRNSVSLQTIMLKLKQLNHPLIIISPGPGSPKESGCTLQILNLCKGKFPILGICLGFQAIVLTYGGKITSFNKTVHGKASSITHDSQEMFSGIQNPFLAGRYHSLTCNDIPKSLTVNARAGDTVMAVRNNVDRVCGFQFHPESILTPDGALLLRVSLMWLNT